MLPASTLRVSGWLIYVFSVLTLMTGAPAFARVLIIVDKSTQQMSVSVDGIPRYRFAVSTGRRGTGRRTAPTIRSVWRPRGFRSCITIHPCLIRSFSTVDMQSMAAMRSIGSADLLAWLHSPAPCERRSSLRIGEKRRYGSNENRCFRKQSSHRADATRCSAGHS